MGSIQRYGYSWIQTNYINSGPSNPACSWTNDTDKTRILKSLTGRAGTVDGTVEHHYKDDTSSDKVITATGQPVTLRVDARIQGSHNYSEYVTVSKSVGVQYWSDSVSGQYGYTSKAKTEGQIITFNFEPGVSVLPGQTVEFWLSNASPNGAVLGFNFEGLSDSDILQDSEAKPENMVSIVFHGNGGGIIVENGSQPDIVSQEVKEGTVFTIPNYEMVYKYDEAGFNGQAEFKGWADSPDATEASYLPGYSFTVNQTTIFYAVWKFSVYRVRWYDGMHTAPIRIDYPVEYEQPLVPPNPGTNGRKIFLGWSTTAYEKVTSNLDIVALWGGGSIWIRIRSSWEHYSPYSGLDEIPGKDYSKIL